MIKYENIDIEQFLNELPQTSVGFDFLNESGLALNDVSLILPLSRFKNLIEIGKEITIDDVFVGDIYDIKKNYESDSLEIIARHKIYELTIAEEYTYTATQKNPVVAMKEIIEQFVDAKYIDDDNFSQIANIFSSVKIDFDVSGDNVESPMTTISLLNQILGLGIYIENNKIKLFYISTDDLSGGVDLSVNDALVEKAPQTYYNYDYLKDAVILNYFDLASAEQSATKGDGKKILSIDIGVKMRITSIVADFLVERIFLLYGKLYETLEMTLKKTSLVSVGKVIKHDSKFYVVKNLTDSTSETSIIGIGG